MTKDDVKKLFGKYVSFDKYLTKIRDGAYIEITNNSDGDIIFHKSTVEIDESSVDTVLYDGFNPELHKVLYAEKDIENGRGIVIGVKPVVISEWLIIDETIWGKQYVRREHDKIIDCAIIAYANCKTRIVPVTEIKGEINE